ncbi:iron-containing alcohol dehydrogenase family protein [Bacillus sp. 03113]|uniref:iron-containing alcohol dehydrogenase family protein n=1 Tax=Bacillus sp. 03113 TaxID=2578211 RepID=UPI001142DB59|nr:iron-containing alcohol dehydrogenase family protein [Bacillus sp. 03113]
MVEIEVRGAPTYYACQAGILDQLEELLTRYKKKNCLVVHGEKSWNSIKPYFPVNLSEQLSFVPYNGECSDTEINRISNISTEGNFDAIIGIGGGKVLDVVKAAGNATDLDVILIPTLASTCAAWTPLSVIYTEQGEFIRYTVFPKSTLMVLIEPRAILHSPTSYLVAGIGDTLAKWYEADVIIRDLDEKPLVVTIAHQAAKLCKDVLLTYGSQAVQDQKNEHLTSTFIKVIEANIIPSGMVGGFGDRYGRIAGAHAIHNGLTTLEETHHLLHGEKVAYGILVQLALEGNWEEIKQLQSFYESLNLPLTFQDLGLNVINKEKLLQIAEAAVLPNESIHLMPGIITADDVLKAINSLESFIVKQI